MTATATPAPLVGRTSERAQDRRRRRTRISRRSRLTLDQRLILRRRLERLAQWETHPVEHVATAGAQAAAAYSIGVRQAVRDALAKLADGTYGQCERCHEPIPIERLEAVPYARRCGACQERVESGWDELRGLVGYAVRVQAGEPQGPSEIAA